MWFSFVLFVLKKNSDSDFHWIKDRPKALLSCVCASTTTTAGLVASSQVFSWWFNRVLAGVVRMLGVGYREVNQDQSSDPLALFRTSKAYSSLFSQYTLTAISAVSPDKDCVCVWLYLCTWAKELWVSRIRNLHTDTYILKHLVTWTPTDTYFAGG